MEEDLLEKLFDGVTNLTLMRSLSSHRRLILMASIFTMKHFLSFLMTQHMLYMCLWIEVRYGKTLVLKYRMYRRSRSSVFKSKEDVLELRL